MQAVPYCNSCCRDHKKHRNTIGWGLFMSKMLQRPKSFCLSLLMLLADTFALMVYINSVILLRESQNSSLDFLFTGLLSILFLYKLWLLYIFMFQFASGGIIRHFITLWKVRKIKWKRLEENWAGIHCLCCVMQSKELVHHYILSILKQCLSWNPKSSGNFICIFPFSDTSGNLLNEYRIFCVQCTEFGE